MVAVVKLSTYASSLLQVSMGMLSYSVASMCSLKSIFVTLLNDWASSSNSKSKGKWSDDSSVSTFTLICCCLKPLEIPKSMALGEAIAVMNIYKFLICMISSQDLLVLIYSFILPF